MPRNNRGKHLGGKLRKVPKREKNHTVEVMLDSAMSDEYEREPTYVAVREGRAYRCVPVTPTARLCGACVFDEISTAPRGKSDEIADCSLEPKARSCPRCLAEILTWPVAGIFRLSPLSPEAWHTAKPQDDLVKREWTKKKEARDRKRSLQRIQEGKCQPSRPAVNRDWGKTGEADCPWWVGDLEDAG